MRTLARLLAALALQIPLLTGPAIAQSALSLPVGSPLYDDLEHFRALGLWSGSLESRPLPRADVAEIVLRILADPRARSSGPGDQVRLRRLVSWMAHDASQKARPASQAGHQEASSDRDCTPALWELGLAVQFFGVATDLDSLADLDRRPRRDGGIFLSVNAQIAGRLAVETRSYEDYGDLTPTPGGGHWVDNMPPDARGILTKPKARNDRAVLGWGWGWGGLRFGREDRHWGAGRRGTLFLSENSFPLDGLSLRVRTRYVSGTGLLAQTRRGRNLPRTGLSPALGTSLDGETSNPPGSAGDAYMAAHRFEITPPWPVRVGLYEAVVYSGRGLDLGYANPVGLFVAMTQDIYDHSGADDKKILGADLSVDLPSVTLYGELLLNRLVALDAASGRDPQISSYAELLGLRWSNPFRWNGADLDLEYAHLDPEVYFHKDNDPGRSFVTGGEIIGHWVGPNADNLHATLAAPPFEKRGTLRLEFEQTRWGLVNGQRGIDMGFVGMTKKDKRWITGDRQVERIVSLNWVLSDQDLRGPLRLDTVLTLAHVGRTDAWGGSGWQAEVRTRCHFDGAWSYK